MWKQELRVTRKKPNLERSMLELELEIEEISEENVKVSSQNQLPMRGVAQQYRSKIMSKLELVKSTLHEFYPMVDAN
ncbi:hypothetical protein Lal_00050084 [Lupinus albus]|nr:hypothetical protein Lal_00050084 [Lupinus albus]